MAFWWVSQNKTFSEERNGGYIWAPIKDKRGIAPYHWHNVSLVKRGDTIYSYVGGKFVAVGEAISDAYRSKKPFVDSEDAWENDGRRVDVRYRDLARPVDLSEIVALTKVLQVKYGPLDAAGRGVQGYMFSISEAVGQYLAGKTG